jgi:hypothetical protein
LPYERALNTGLKIADGKEAGQMIMTSEVYVTPDYFGALQIPVLMGRSFTDADGPDSQRVAIVNQTFVRKFFHGTSPIGRYVDKDTMIVGMVGDVAIAPGLEVTAPLAGEEGMYVPATQMETKMLHRPGLHDSSSHGPYRSARITRFGTGTRCRFGPMRRSITRCTVCSME